MVVSIRFVGALVHTIHTDTQRARCPDAHTIPICVCALCGWIARSRLLAADLLLAGFFYFLTVNVRKKWMWR